MTFATSRRGTASAAEKSGARSLLPHLLLVLAFGVSVGCAGAYGNVTFNDLRYPVSTSGYLFDGSGQRVSILGMKRLADFNIRKRYWGLLYSAIPLTAKSDFSDEINRAIRDVNGQGAVNLTVTVSDCGANKVPLLTLLPFWPGCSNVTVAGSVVEIITSVPPSVKLREDQTPAEIVESDGGTPAESTI